MALLQGGGYAEYAGKENDFFILHVFFSIKLLFHQILFD
jgi:hypothetical protein